MFDMFSQLFAKESQKTNVQTWLEANTVAYGIGGLASFRILKKMKTRLLLKKERKRR